MSSVLGEVNLENIFCALNVEGKYLATCSGEKRSIDDNARERMGP